MKYEFLTIFAVIALLGGFGAPLSAEEDGAGEDERALALIDALVKDVQEMRGLEFREPFARKLISSSEIPAMLREKLAEELPPEKLAKMNKLYSRLGFIAPGVDLAEVVTQLLEAGAAGFYDPEAKTLYLVRGFSVSGAQPVLFHELVHALEDQHYGLHSFRDRVKDHGDRAAAMMGVVEGSAQGLMNRWLAARPEIAKALREEEMKKGLAQAQKILSVPTVIVAGMAIYPYGNGPVFVNAATGNDPRKAGDLFTNMPQSTEQILHPEKYAKTPDVPQEVSVGDVAAVLPEGWAADFSDTIGEMQIGLLLNEFAGGPPAMKLVRVINPFTQVLSFQGAAATAAAGWDGDRIVSYFSKDGQVGFVWPSVWDSERDATEFADAYRAGLTYKWQELRLTPETAIVDRRGDKVMIVEGFPAEVMSRILESAWEGTVFDVPFAPDGGENEPAETEPAEDVPGDDNGE
ncbi:MAG: hypothetical protein MUE73_11645 [Planctomycetes bacterium]|jgi:hypothetical protein|nr:hypothetical protein [Planctomycetota bacterium]